MPKLPDDMSDEAKARRAQMSAQGREVQAKAERRLATAQDVKSEIDRIAADLGFEPDAMTFICRRGNG